MVSALSERAWNHWPALISWNDSASFQHRLLKLRSDIGCPDNGRNKNSHLFKQIEWYPLNFTAKNMIPGTELLDLKKNSHKEGLLEMARSFLEKDGHGAQFWPSNSEDGHYRHMTYATHAAIIRVHLVEIFWYLNLIRENIRRPDISTRPAPQQTASTSSYAEASSSRSSQSGRNASEPICVDEPDSRPIPSVESATNQTLPNGSEAPHSYPQPRYGTFEPRMTPLNGHDIQNTSIGTTGPQRSAPVAPEAPMAEPNVGVPSSGRGSTNRRGGRTGKRSYPPLFGRHDNGKTKRAKHQATAPATAPTTATTVASTTTTTGNGATVPPPPIATTAEKGSEGALSAKSSGPARTSGRKRKPTQHQDMVSWGDVSVDSSIQSRDTSVSLGDAQTPAQGTARSELRAQPTKTPLPSLREDTMETVGRQAEDDFAELSSEDEFPSFPFTPINRPINRPIPVPVSERPQVQHSAVNENGNTQAPQPQPEVEAERAHNRLGDEFESENEPPNQPTDKASVMMSEDVLSQAAEPDPLAQPANAVTEGGYKGNIELKGTYIVRREPRVWFIWEMQGGILRTSLGELVTKLPVRGDLTYSGLLFSLTVFKETLQQHIPEGDESAFRRMKDEFQIFLYEATNRARARSIEVLPFKVKIDPHWVGETRRQLMESQDTLQSLDF
ncbi:hypothetical protein BGZ63DRAFT_459328 [Mariannaea sp. PMI_226]|nr:hypothetical protein BGZ63DRAFT_459328 [Mariannaea sp. PMI_226]